MLVFLFALFGGFAFGWCLVFYLVVTSLRPSGLEQFTFVGLSISGRPCICGNSLLQPNLQHAIERVERPGGSHEGVGPEKKVSMTVERLALCRFTELMQQQHRS